MLAENIPAEMATENRWILWEAIPDVEGRKPRKVPRIATNSGSLSNAKSNDPSTWRSFAKAVTALKIRRKQGRDVHLGFILGDGWAGIDLDDCYDEDGELHDWAFKCMGIVGQSGYAEVSPSSKGVKVFFKATKPSGYRSTKRFDGTQAIEVHGDSARFYAVTGDVLWDCLDADDQQRRFDLVCKEFLSPTHGNTRKPASSSGNGRGGIGISMESIFGLGDTPAGVYAQAILNAGEVITAGGRNNKIFNIAGNVAKKTDDPVELFSIMQTINQRLCDPPMSDYELRTTVESSTVNGDLRVDTPKPDKFDLYLEDSPELSVLLDTMVKSVIENGKKTKKSTISADVFDVPGVIGKIYSEIVEQAKDVLPELAFANALTAFATATSGHVMLRGASPNIFVIGLAPSGSGKEFGRKYVKKLLADAGLESRIGPDGLSSAEGYARILSEQNISLFQLDEAAEMLGEMRGSSSFMAQRIGKALKESYSANGVWRPNCRADGKLDTLVSEPLPIFYLTTTPTAFWESFSPKSVEDGLLGRLLVFQSGYSTIRGRTYSPPTPSEAVIQSLAAWSGVSKDGNLPPETFPDNRLQWQMTPAAEACLIAFDNEIMDRLTQQWTALWKRTSDKIIKLSLLFAASRLGPIEDGQVDACDVKRAIEIVKRLTYRTIEAVDTQLVHNEADSFRQKILATVKRHPGGFPKNKLSNNVRGNRKLREDALNDLLEAGVLVYYVDKNGEKMLGVK